MKSNLLLLQRLVIENFYYIKYTENKIWGQPELNHQPLSNGWAMWSLNTTIETMHIYYYYIVLYNYFCTYFSIHFVFFCLYIHIYAAPSNMKYPPNIIIERVSERVIMYHQQNARLRDVLYALIIVLNDNITCIYDRMQ